MYELLTGASPFTVDGEKNSQSQISKYVGFSFIALIIEIIFVNFYIKIDSFLSCSIHLYLICSLIVVQTSAYDTKIYKICEICRVIFLPWGRVFPGLLYETLPGLLVCHCVVTLFHHKLNLV